MNNPIPQVLHQTWKTKQLPTQLDLYRESWKRCHPNWQFPLYDDPDCRAFVRFHFPDLLALYDAYPTNIQRADMFRYLVVYERGGVYADLDMECWKCIEPILIGRACVFATEATFGKRLQAKLDYRHGYQVANCIFAAAPRHPFLKFVIDHLRANRLTGSSGSDHAAEETTGPRFLTRLYQEHRELFPDFVLLPQIYWTPPNQPGYPNLFPFNVHIYCKHHFQGSWKRKTGAASSFKERYAERWHHPSPWFRRDFEPARMISYLIRRLRTAAARRHPARLITNGQAADSSRALS